MKQVKLLEICGLFCTKRDAPSIVKLTDIIQVCLDKNEKLSINREGVKILSVSYVDELISPFLQKISFDVFFNQISFEPPLEEFYNIQLKRSIMLRK